MSRRPRVGRRWSDLSLDPQFVTGSLVYNSGILFSTERVAQILDLFTGPYLAQVNRDNEGKRTRLALYAPEEAKRRLIAGEHLPEQLTSWSAVYHVVQRYGAWMALRRFSTVFDEEGAFRVR